MATSELVMLPRNEGSGMSSSAGEHWHSAGLYINTRFNRVVPRGCRVTDTMRMKSTLFEVGLTSLCTLCNAGHNGG